MINKEMENAGYGDGDGYGNGYGHGYGMVTLLVPYEAAFYGNAMGGLLE